ncbi:50S ribosomal protein L22 [Candidatus Falkowbacteria bacterium CG_4_10_14_0_2_um_filter_36_22]|uniref:Large ribosomal subunit protein uL22 n=2 Tax=Candidatus Falkowiibacteriota TaxID=1752728 RepID=A0A1J4TAS9_9BACT|nr:MAG: 50S ribosomal protein L22 [Candidatus Falkowbacteria bacterium CG1_02_37_44]PIV51873.1 MAG: 50S ribosomal protein L22 [Candidatus Falkowbacteria bacterium CG02_land_8_20_14_3_00_36_14]PJA10847.1 MAG: 50S ribosomal protein L22 [Candidatus Falkowbacteria bacterium CG_4_10_14_0_2_um_filter_36_22]
MEIKAKVKHIHMSPRKVRLVVNVIRGWEVNKALDQLKFINKWAAKPIIKLINSAIANANNNYEIAKDNLYIKEIRVDEGATIHRWMPKAHGRATPIRKRTSHVYIVLSEIKASVKKQIKRKETEAPIRLSQKPKDEKYVSEKRKEVSKEKMPSEFKSEKGKVIVDPREEGQGKHTKIEGSSQKGFVNKIFRRKSG